MKTIKVNQNHVSQEQIDLIVAYLNNGKVIAYPTDTIYGLGCDARNAQAVEKLRRIKGRNDNKPMLVLVSDFAMLKEYCLVSPAQEKILEKLWFAPVDSDGEKPVTVILDGRNNLPPSLTAGLNTLAARLPRNDLLIKLISRAGFPIVSTSLNKTGEPPLNSLTNLPDYFSALPDLAVDIGTIAGHKPSSIIDLRDEKNIKIIRK